MSGRYFIFAVAISIGSALLVAATPSVARAEIVLVTPPSSAAEPMAATAADPNSDQIDIVASGPHEIDADRAGKGVMLEAMLPMPRLRDAFSTVPETAIWVMMLVGFAGVGFVIRRRKHVADRVSA